MEKLVSKETEKRIKTVPYYFRSVREREELKDGKLPTQKYFPS